VVQEWLSHTLMLNSLIRHQEWMTAILRICRLRWRKWSRKPGQNFLQEIGMLSGSFRQMFGMRLLYLSVTFSI
jgi:hypothetical protein